MYVSAGTVAPLSTSRAAAQDWSTSTSVASAVRSAGVSSLSNCVRSTLSPRNAQFSGVRSSCELRYRFRGKKEVTNVTANHGIERAVNQNAHIADVILVDRAHEAAQGPQHLVLAHAELDQEHDHRQGREEVLQGAQLPRRQLAAIPASPIWNEGVRSRKSGCTLTDKQASTHQYHTPLSTNSASVVAMCVPTTKLRATEREIKTQSASLSIGRPVPAEAIVVDVLALTLRQTRGRRLLEQEPAQGDAGHEEKAHGGHVHEHGRRRAQPLQSKGRG